jgi:hypothetical protein
MAAREREIVRELREGLSVAWDTTDVPAEMRAEFAEAERHQVDLIVRSLGDGGEKMIVEAKTNPESAKLDPV